jgi:hypothetical protein
VLLQGLKGNGISQEWKWGQNLPNLCYINTVWAADFEPPAGSSTFFSFFFCLGSIGKNEQKIIASCCFKACGPELS